MPGGHKLSEDENERIFREEIVRSNLRGGTPQEAPVAYLLGGQPGAGKSRVENELMDRLDERGQGIKIDGDEFRERHPDYRQLMRDDDESMATETGPDSGRWVEKSINHTADRDVDMVVSGTMRDPAVVERTADHLHDSGYRVEAYMVATPEAESRLGILERYQGQRIENDHGRFSTAESHDAAYAGMLSTADHIDESKCVDAVHVYNRDGTELYHNELDENGDWKHETGTRAAIEAERNKEWSPEKTRDFDERVANVRDPELPPHASPEKWQSPEWQSKVDEAAVCGEGVRSPEVEPATLDRGGEPVQGEAVQGENVQGEAVHGEAVHGESVAGGTVSGEPVAGEPEAGEPVADAGSSVQPAEATAAEEPDWSWNEQDYENPRSPEPQRDAGNEGDDIGRG